MAYPILVADVNGRSRFIETISISRSTGACGQVRRAAAGRPDTVSQRPQVRGAVVRRAAMRSRAGGTDL